MSLAAYCLMAVGFISIRKLFLLFLVHKRDFLLPRWCAERWIFQKNLGHKEKYNDVLWS